MSKDHPVHPGSGADDLTEVEGHSHVPASDELPEQVGAYRILSRLGAGGMGEVFLAEQREPVQRRVALKLVGEGGRGTANAFFEVERQVLAQMQHPAIAQVYDAGTTAAGRPWFAMEWVAGAAITRYCNERKLPVTDILSLFIRVCHGLHHAHQRGIIHRDIKPANVLVHELDGMPQPKIIDFGVATSIDQSGACQLSGTSGASGTRCASGTGRASGTDRAGTRAYMSPEQIAGNRAQLDIRTDVYALGVLLFELLTHTRPPASSAPRALSDFCRVLSGDSRHRPPRDNETREAEHDQLQAAASSSRELPHELRCIIARAIAPDRESRYESAAALATEIRHYLDGYTVSAVPFTRTYRWRKFISRNRLSAAAIGGAVLALTAGITLAVWGLLAAQTERDRAQAEALSAAQTAGFVSNMLSSIDPAYANGADTTLMRRVLTDAAERAPRELGDQPRLLSEIEYVIANAYLAIGEHDQARRHAQRAADLIQPFVGDPRQIRPNILLSVIDGRTGQYPQGLERIEHVLETMHGHYAEHDFLRLDALHVRAHLLILINRNEAAEPAARQILALTEGATEPRWLNLRLEGLRSLAQIHANLGRYEQGQRRYEQLRAEAGTWNHPDAARHITAGLNDQAVSLLGQQRYAEAEVLLRESLERQQAYFGGSHPLMVHTMGNLASSVRQQGRLEEAGEVFEAVRVLALETLGPDHPSSVIIHYNLGNLMRELGEVERAIELQTEARVRGTGLFPDDHPIHGMFQLGLGQGELARGNARDAAPLLAAAVERLTAAHGPEFHRTQEARLALSSALDMIGDQKGTQGRRENGAHD